MKKNPQPNNLLTTHYSLQTSGGFTLIEILLVTFISGLVFVAIYLLYAGTIKQDVESRYEIIASNLAQEGIEIIRNKRDEELLAGNNIDFATGVCHPKVDNSGGGNCGNAATSDDVGYDALTYYNCQAACGAGKGTPFKRVCNITASDSDGVDGNDTLKVECTVSWKSFVNPDIARNVKAVSILTDWNKD